MSRRVTDLLTALLLGAGMLAFALSSPNIAGGDDAYRHVRFAHRLVTETGVALTDPWRLEYLWPQPVDVWFGYHLWLAPFTLLLPLIPAAKLGGSLVWAGTAFAILRWLDRMGVVWRQAWMLLAVAGSGIVLYRVTLMRPFLISLLCTVLAARYVREERPWPVALVSAVHAFSYSIFFFVGLPAAAYFLARRTARAFWVGVASGAGMLAGLAVSPFFPENAKFSLAAATTRAGVDMARMLEAGGEVLPISVWWLVASIPMLGAWAAAIVVVALRWRRERPEPAVWMLFGVSLAALAISARAARMFDYFVPFAALFAAAVLAPWVARNKEKAAYAFGGALLLVAASVAPAVVAARGAPAIERYRAASEFLAAQPGPTLVWNTEWQQYPFLYYWNWSSRYITGMEPALFYNAAPERYWQWRKLADDAVEDAAGLDALVFRDFGATHILVEYEKSPRLAAQLAAHPRVAEVFRDASIAVFAPRGE